MFLTRNSQLFSDFSLDCRHFDEDLAEIMPFNWIIYEESTKLLFIFPFGIVSNLTKNDTECWDKKYYSPSNVLEKGLVQTVGTLDNLEYGHACNSSLLPFAKDDI